MTILLRIEVGIKKMTRDASCPYDGRISARENPELPSPPFFVNRPFIDKARTLSPKHTASMVSFIVLRLWANRQRPIESHPWRGKATLSPKLRDAHILPLLSLPQPPAGCQGKSGFVVKACSPDGQQAGEEVASFFIRLVLLCKKRRIRNYEKYSCCVRSIRARGRG